jgi:dTDP-4-amino-4,6-dideoxygalactose transaminase
MDAGRVEDYLTKRCTSQSGTLTDRATGRRVSCLLPVHLFGQPADMDPLLELARRFGLKLVEDACQAHGAKYKGRPAGTMGDAAAFSFYPGKNLGAMGEAGAITTGDAAIADRCRVLREHGQREKYIHVTADGSNARLDPVQAVVLQAKLARLGDWNDARRRVAAGYRERLGDLDIVLPSELPFAHHVYHLYVVQVRDRDRVRGVLDRAGIGTGLHYPVPLHLQEAYADLRLARGTFPVSEQVAERGLSLPMFPHLTEPQADAVTEALHAALATEAAPARR